MITFAKSLNVDEDLEQYGTAWQLMLKKSGLSGFEQQAIPTTLSIKVADKPALFTILEDNTPVIEQVHIATVNDRYIASAALKQPYDGLPILKVLERRHGSKDPLGLDSLDYLVDDLAKTFTKLKAVGLNIVREHNDMHAWLSLRFGPQEKFEAKFTDHLVLEVSVKELRLASGQIRQQLGSTSSR